MLQHAVAKGVHFGQQNNGRQGDKTLNGFTSRHF